MVCETHTRSHGPRYAWRKKKKGAFSFSFPVVSSRRLSRAASHITFNAFCFFVVRFFFFCRGFVFDAWIFTVGFHELSGM